MTRKDYVLIAAAIRQARENAPQGIDGIEAVVDALVARLGLDNERFNPATFRAACK